jgi:hypothetical protein
LQLRQVQRQDCPARNCRAYLSCWNKHSKPKLKQCNRLKQYNRWYRLRLAWRCIASGTMVSAGLKAIFLHSSLYFFTPLFLRYKRPRELANKLSVRFFSHLSSLYSTTIFFYRLLAPALIPQQKKTTTS